MTVQDVRFQLPGQAQETHPRRGVTGAGLAMNSDAVNAELEGGGLFSASACSARLPPVRPVGDDADVMAAVGLAVGEDPVYDEKMRPTGARVACRITKGLTSTTGHDQEPAFADEHRIARADGRCRESTTLARRPDPSVCVTVTRSRKRASASRRQWQRRFQCHVVS